MIGNEQTMIGVSEILNSFNVAEISRLLDSQINKDYDEDVYMSMQIDHFQPLYYNYTRLTKFKIDEEIAKEAEYKYFEICKVILNKIFDKFDIELNESWIDDNYTKLPVITLCFYQFFVLDFVSNVEEFFHRYLVKNMETVSKTFEGMKNKKDASTISNRKNLSTEMSVIVSNIYDIIIWIIDNSSADDFLEYQNHSYIPSELIRSLYKEGNINDKYIGVLQKIIRENINLRSTIGFNITYKIKNGDIKDIFSEAKI